MTYLLSPQLKEFYDNGILNILNIIPKNLDIKDQLSIESVVYTAYGLYRNYQFLENKLSEITNDDGSLRENNQNKIRDAFNGAWSVIHASYEINQLIKIESISRFLKISDKLRPTLESASLSRNNITHLKNNFNNTVSSGSKHPLFGWLVYQFSPILRSNDLPKNEFYLINVGSTILRGNMSFEARKLAKLTVLSSIDHIHFRDSTSNMTNLSQLFVDLTLDLNNFSIAVHTFIAEKFSDPLFDLGGVLRPFPAMVVKGVEIKNLVPTEINTLLEQNKVRFQIDLNTTASKTE